MSGAFGRLKAYSGRSGTVEMSCETLAVGSGLLGTNQLGERGDDTAIDAMIRVPWLRLCASWCTGNLWDKHETCSRRSRRRSMPYGWLFRMEPLAHSSRWRTLQLKARVVRFEVMHGCSRLADAPVIAHATGHYVAGVRASPQIIPSQSQLTPTQRESLPRAPPWEHDAQPRSPLSAFKVPSIPQTLGGSTGGGSAGAASELHRAKSTLNLEADADPPARGLGPEKKDAMYYRTKCVSLNDGLF